ncbi:hypothetical protein [Novipirellula rosea]|uniref:Uncharacterized protein n=1 Tax=Novipirellula rosea TaxID=1031540 RepID=A0ABP8N8Q4_9BACT|tara:strand:- start:432 stop:1136 length:705 start_codon:yes stop_codon:yes gene_type:complete
MYCVHCGADGAATFCAKCGQRQEPLVGDDPPSAESSDSIIEAVDNKAAVIEAVIHWTDSIQYETVLASDDARKRITLAARDSRQGVTGEDLLAVFDAVSPIGFSLVKLSKVILPICDKLGLKTDRHATEVFFAPPGRVLLATLCALAAKSLMIAEVHQDIDKCSLTAELPSTLITNCGKLHLLLEESDGCVQVSVATTISAQWYDWGKSKRLIAEIFAAIDSDLHLQQSDQRAA